MPSQLPSRRRERLLALLRSRGSIRVSEIAAELGVSQPTLRRDLAVLTERGLIQREHGGATTIAPTATGAAVPRTGSGEARQTIGMVVPNLQYYFPDVARGAKDAADQAGGRLILRGSDYDTAVDREQIGALLASAEVHGLVVAPNLADPAAPALLRWLDGLSVPVVLVERQPDPYEIVERLQWVASDHRRGGVMATEHLHSQGHRRIGFFGTDNVTGTQVAVGWADTLRRHGIDPEDQLVGPSGAFRRNSHETMTEVARRVHDGTLTGLIVQPDPDARALAQRCPEFGIRIPEDLAIVAYDDEIASIGEPALTAVRPAKRHVGQFAVTLLLNQLRHGADAPPQQVLIRPQLRIRESSIGRVCLS